jgi:hypothetical protein
MHSYPTGEQTSLFVLSLIRGLSKFQLKTECSTKRNHQLEAKSTGEGFWELVENANDWNRSRDLGNSIAYLENRRQPRRNLIGSVEELYNEMKNRLQQVSTNPFQGLK